MSHVDQTVMPQTFIGGHDGTERDYSLSANAVIPLAAIGEELGPLKLTARAYRSTITAIRVHGTLCDTSMTPDGVVTTVLPFSTEGPSNAEPITVAVYDTPVWLRGLSNAFEIDFTRHAQPVGDGDRTTVWASMVLTYNLPTDRAHAAPLWTWGANGDGQQGIGTTDDVLAPLSSEEHASPATPFDDAVDVSAGGMEEGTRALVRRAADMLERAAGYDADGATFTRPGDTTLWTPPTVPSRSPDHTTRQVWGMSKVDLGRAHGILSDGWGTPNLYGVGFDGGPQGTGVTGDDQPVFTKLPTDDPTSPWPFPARAPQVYCGDDFTEVIGANGDLFNRTSPYRVYGSGDSNRLNAGGAGNRFGTVYGEAALPTYTLPNGWGEASGAKHTVLLATDFGSFPATYSLRSWGDDDKGQCGRGSVAATRLAGTTLAPWGTRTILYVSCGWKGTTILVANFAAPPESRYELWSWGYPHPLGDADGLGFINGVAGAIDDYCHTPLQIPLPDLSYPNDIPPPDPADYEYPGGDVDYANDLADWEARPPLVYATPQFVLHGRGHRVLVAQRPLAGNMGESPEYRCWDVWTQGWNDHGQLGNGSSGGHQAGWSLVLALRPPLTEFGFYGNLRVTVGWDTNYAIGLACELAATINQVAVLVG